MISDLTLIHRFSGSNRRYVLTLDNGEQAWFRARNMREARRIANEFVGRLPNRTLIGIDYNE